MTDETMELTHQDLILAFDRVIQQLTIIEESKVFSGINTGMFDIEEMTKVLISFKNKVVVDAYTKGTLEWK
jgi:hypothetical protein